MAYDSLNPAVLRLVPTGVREVLDLGCGEGANGEALRDREKSCRVTGITHDPHEAEIAGRRLDCVIKADLNEMSFHTLGRFDCVVCSHVLEHLHHPDQVLVRIRESLEPAGTVVVGLPNVLFWKQRLEFLRGRFRYTEGGLMDRTHYRFFDYDSARELVSLAGFTVDRTEVGGGFPMSRFLRQLGRSLDRVAVSCFPGLFGWQFVLRGRAPLKRDVDELKRTPARPVLSQVWSNVE